MKAAQLLPIAALLVTGLVLYGCQNAAPTPVAGTRTTTGSTTSGSSGHLDSIQRTYHLKDLQRVTLKANGHDLPTWVMDTEDKQREGMMWLTADDVEDNDGMIFVFPSAKEQSFWMENTILALDIIYISDKKKVVSIAEGMPHDKTSLPSHGASMYVLEMKQGSAKRLGIGPGTEITIPDDVKSKY